PEAGGRAGGPVVASGDQRRHCGEVVGVGRVAETQHDRDDDHQRQRRPVREVRDPGIEAEHLVPLPVMPPSFWVASTKPEAALACGQGWQPWQERGWALAPRDRGPEAGMYCWMGHLTHF